MTNNETFIKLCQLTGLSVDLSALEKIMGRRGIVMTKSRFNKYRDGRKKMTDEELSLFIQALFDLRKEADDGGIVLFDCRGIYDEIDKVNNND